MTTNETVRCSDLARLRDEYERRAAQNSKNGRQPGSTGYLQRGKAACYLAVAADLNDLICGRKHPSARRS